MMDFDRIKQNLRFRSGRSSTNTSKRFPTAAAVRVPAQREEQRAPSASGVPEKSRKPGKSGELSVRFDTNMDSGVGKETMEGNRSGVEKPRKSLSGSGTGSASKDNGIEQDSIRGPAAKKKKKAGVGKRSNMSQESLDKPEEPESKAPPTSTTDAKPTEPSDSSDAADFDLKRTSQSAPKYRSERPPRQNLETQFDLLLSEEYLATVTTDTQLLARFTAFLNRYRPELTRSVLRYIETQKVVKAVGYANAVAMAMRKGDNGAAKNGEGEVAAVLSSSFMQCSNDAFTTLLTTALPAFITYSLVKTATTCLTAEITNHHSTPLTRGLVGGLSEVFCITDPNQEDNPIVYSSEEFYRLTGYDKYSVLGRNCRFLQGSKTKRESVARLKEAIVGGKEICEALLNYRRDGRPFVNLLMLAPLHDDKGKVKYYLGAQVDASRVVEGGRGVEGFEQFLQRREMEDERRDRDGENNRKQLALAKLRDLSMTFDLEEIAVVQSHSRSSSMTRDDDAGSVGSTDRRRKERRVLRDDDENGSRSEDESDEKENYDPAWSLSHTKPSGGLPGIYRKYFLIRPYPSLRVVFISRAVRKISQLQQRPFLSHVAASRSTLSGLKESFESGHPVTAKIAITAEPRKNGEAIETSRDLAKYGKPCWISATPLLDSEGDVGVWMVVVVDKTGVASNLGRASSAGPAIKEDTRFKLSRQERDEPLEQPGSETEDLPIKPTRVGSPGISYRSAYPASMEEMQHLEDDDTVGRREENEDLAPQVTTDVRSDTLSITGNDPQKEPLDSQPNARNEESGDEEFIDASNVQGDIPNGFQDPESPPIEMPGEKTQEKSNESQAPLDVEQDEIPEEWSKTGRSYGAESHPGRPASRVLTMDYLTSRSPTQGRHSNHIGDDEHADEMDWPHRSPYSVD